jgi:hypothetical protein
LCLRISAQRRTIGTETAFILNDRFVLDDMGRAVILLLMCPVSARDFEFAKCHRDIEDHPDIWGKSADSGHFLRKNRNSDGVIVIPRPNPIDPAPVISGIFSFADSLSILQSKRVTILISGRAITSFSILGHQIPHRFFYPLKH